MSKAGQTWEQAVEWLRAQPEQQQLVRDCYYDDPLTDAAHRYSASEEWADVQKYLPAQRGSALDVGAGRGIASYALARDGFSVSALEPDPSPVVGAEAIRLLARGSGLEISVSEEFSERLPFADEQFDLVFARAVLHHTSDLSRACKEFYRVLKKGGRLIAVREHVVSRLEDLPAFFDGHPLHHLYGGENAFLLKQYRGAISSAGFSLQTTLAPFDSPINFAPYTLDLLQKELTAKLPLGGAFVRGLLRLPVVWRIARVLLRAIDNRPGRLYSFVADKQ